MEKNQNENNQEKFQNEANCNTKSSIERASFGLIKGIKLYNITQGYKYTTKILKRGVNIIDLTKDRLVCRLEFPHKGVSYNHVNINPKISGIPDPHVKLPPGAINAGKACISINKVINEVVIPLTIAVELTRTGIAIHKDLKNGTSRNTVETVVDIAGGWMGGYGGAVGCAGIGTAILPGVGTIIGGIAGGICGGIAGSMGAKELSKLMGDKLNYNINKTDFIKYLKKLGEANKIYCSECIYKLSKIDVKRITNLKSKL